MEPYSFTRFLAAKKAVDDRSLNGHVWSSLAERIRPLQEEKELSVLEVGCGIGTMVERMFDAGLLTRALYTGVDARSDVIAEARTRLRACANEKALAAVEGASAIIPLRRPGQRVDVELIDADAFAFIASRGPRVPYDLVVAHAFLDVVDLGAGLTSLVSAVRPGGFLYLTLVFDGATIFEPPLDPVLDAGIERLYHATMDASRPGSSRTGRRLLAALSRLGIPVLAAGSSDWVVHPGPEGFSPDEAYFLGFIIETVGRALAGNGEFEKGALAAWLGERRRMIDGNQLIYIAHQLDVLAAIDFSGTEV